MVRCAIIPSYIHSYFGQVGTLAISDNRRGARREVRTTKLAGLCWNDQHGPRVKAPSRSDASATATANLNPWTEAKLDTKNPERGPLLIMVGEKDDTVPPAIAKASYNRQERNDGVTEFVTIPGRGHALTIDNGWREVADIALAFVRPFA
jgi:pimeloyl-ACP methyl ester carboxylesterase